MDEKSKDEHFLRVLDRMLESLSDDLTPSVRGFIRGIRARYAALHENGQEGLNAEYLVSDLIGVLSHFEVRLKNLETRAERGHEEP